MKSLSHRRKQALHWSYRAIALAAIAACGGGGGGSDPAAPTNQAPTISIDGPAANATFDEGTAITITATAADSDGSVALVEFFDGATKIGEDASAPFSLSWTGASVGAHTITARVTDNQGAIAVSASQSITVNAVVTPTPNQPPTISLTAPANNFKTNAPATITLATNAADSDGTIAKVEFFRINPAAPVFDASTLVGAADTVAPFEQQVTGLAAGTYTFVARATDNRGAVATSGTVQVIVNALPTVSFTAPAANAVVQVGSTVTLRATAGDADGSVSKVEFFDGATKLGEDTTAPYEFTWSSFPAGPKTLTARATDNDGATQTTASLTINANGQPTVTLDVPTAGANAPTTLALAASASDSDGTISSVQFFNGSTLLGNGAFDAATQRYRLSVPIGAAQHGTYTLTARATDNNGGTATTASRTVTIAPNVAPAVSMTSATTFSLPAAVVFTATASDSDGIARVEFYNGTTKLGEDTTAPYEFTWAAATAGTYSISARAIDTVGTIANSTAQSVTVNPSTVGMWSTLTDAQRAGMTLAPNAPVENVAIDAVQVMTALGVTRYIPSFNPAIGFGSRRLADFVPAAGASITCPGGGTVTASALQAGGNLLLNYDNCVIDGFTFYGGAGMPRYTHIDSTTAPPPAVHPDPNCVGTYAPATATEPAGYRCQIPSSVDYFPTTGRLVISGLRITGNGAPLPGGEAYPRNAIPNTQVQCTGTGASRLCLTNVNNNHYWANNVSWTGWTAGALLPPDPLYATDDTYIVSGVYRTLYGSTPPPAARNIRFEAMTNIGGRAIVYGSNGYSVVTRLAPVAAGVERLSVVRTVVTQVDPLYPVGTSAPIVVECSVIAAQGEWLCQPLP